MMSVCSIYKPFVHSKQPCGVAEDGSVFNCENGSSKNQTSTSEKKRRASKEASHVWVPLKRRKAPRGNPEAAASKR